MTAVPYRVNYTGIGATQTVSGSIIVKAETRDDALVIAARRLTREHRGVRYTVSNAREVSA